MRLFSPAHQPGLYRGYGRAGKDGDFGQLVAEKIVQKQSFRLLGGQLRQV